MNKLTAKQLIMINEKLIGKKPKITAEAEKNIQAIAAEPYTQNERSLYVYRDNVSKAAKLGCAIMQGKPFLDKNSQTAIVALMTFLELNGIGLVGYENNLSQLITHLENDNIDAVCQWIGLHKSESSITKI